MNIMGWLVMRPPSSWLGLVLSFFFGSLLFLVERLFIAFSGIPGRGISRFYFFMAFISYQLLLPPGPLSPSSHGGVTPQTGHPNVRTRGMG
jgi:hypothetical protein